MGRKGHICIGMPDTEMAVSVTGAKWYLALKDKTASFAEHLQQAVNATNLNDVVLLKEISDCPYCGRILKPHPYITGVQRLSCGTPESRSRLSTEVRESPRWGGVHKFPRWE